MYKIGEKVIYGQTGVCLITDICEKEFIRKEKKQYYVLQPVASANNVIYAPVDNPKVFMRYLITSEQADELIASIPQIVENIENDAADLSEYREEMQNYTLEALVGLTAKIYAKKKEVTRLKKRLNNIDEKYMKLGECLLFGELAEVLGIPFEEVQKYIAERIEKGM